MDAEKLTVPTQTATESDRAIARAIKERVQARRRGAPEPAAVQNALTFLGVSR